MTQNSYKGRDDRNTANDDDVYTALWANAPFPRLPKDAPGEIVRLTIELEDPKRIYCIHKASRRHHFQLLVERYIHQIRYGCQSRYCTTTTCFSCRRRLAGGAPVRRYNATSARTLAIYMASQDNPEHGLCQSQSAPRPTSENTRTFSSHRISGELLADAQKPSENGASEVTRRKEPNVKLCDSTSEAKENDVNSSKDDILYKRVIPDLAMLEEPTTTDPRSFVQNVVSTVAFKMLEWLTPRNLDLLVKSQGQARLIPTECASDLSKVLSSNRPTLENVPLGVEVPAPTLGPPESKESRSSDRKTAPHRMSEPEKPAAIPNAQLSHAREPRLTTGPDNHASTVSKLLTRNDSIDTQHLKGILSKPPKQTEISSDITPQPRPTLQRRLSRQASSISSTAFIKDSVLSAVSGIKPTTVQVTQNTLDHQETRTEEETTKNRRNTQILLQNEVARSRSNIMKMEDHERPVLPQSLSHFSIEIVEYICDLMQAENISESHPLHPREIDASLRRKLDGSSQIAYLQRMGTDSSKFHWKQFIEQSLFDVLSRPDSLLQSFRKEGGDIFDTQTIWYLMLRMTRVAPSIVFDSLWRLVGELFHPPKPLDSTCEWSRDIGKGSGSGRPVSNQEAADIINICLHALIAAAPLVSEIQQLTSMSRVRSFGLAMHGGSESSSPEYTNLCLQYEDAFTYDLGLRLARRLFAAIPTRRHFNELLESRNDAHDDHRPEPEILDRIIKSLKFLDIGVQPLIKFTTSERDLHEKRVPTLILDWARTIMLQEWQGTAEVPVDGPFGGALATMDAIYENRKALLLGDMHFRTEYFAERLDPVDMPVAWLSFEPNKRTVHLLDHPYLFKPSTLVTYFRALNYSRMNRAYETAKASGGLMYSTIAENSLMTDKHSRDQLYHRLETATTRFNVLEIRRTDVLKDTFNSIWRREERELLRPLKVRLGQDDGDEGMDSGGVQQEFFRLAVAEAVNPDYGAFTIDARSNMTWFQPGSAEPLWKYELIGMLFSLAVYNGLTLPVTFPKALYRKLLDQEVTELHHIKDGWGEIEKNLTHLLEWDEKDGLVEDVFVLTYEFSSDIFGKASPEPIEAGMVTRENRNNYVSDYIRWLTDISVEPQFDAFRKGFFSLIDRKTISLFTSDTLQSIVEGIQEIDISEMRRTTNYVGWNASHRTVRDFWSIVKRYSLDQKRKLLEFATASDRVPVGGMKNLQFTLQRNGIDDNHLPTSYTCYGILLLPEYSTKDILREKLAMALENSKGFGFA